jgi:cytochrome oxidase Cu insertion factor (SCO1/SenC/PrrC family)
MTNQRLSSIVLLLAATGISTTPVFSQPPAHQHTQASTEKGGTGSARSANIKVPDVVVLDQDNHPLNFYRDLVQGKTVAVNFIFTTCTTICPPLTANFASVQRKMLKRGEKNLHLISVSVDPESDTPAKLKAYAEMFKAQPGWTFVTGSRSQLEKIWNAFGITGGNKLDHSPTVAIGNDPRHQWTFASGLNSPEKLARVIDSVLDNSGTEPAISAGK